VSEDPYAVLGVKREATQDEIAKPRQLAKSCTRTSSRR